MSRFVTALAFVAMSFPASHLFSIEVCLVNDSDRTAIITMIAGSERYERRLKPRTQTYVRIADTKDDRVVIAQALDESTPNALTSSIKVVDTKVVAGDVNRLNFCYVHGNTTEGLRMDLFAFVCLDIVPQRWGKEPSEDERFPQLKSQLIKSLRSTTEIDPNSNSHLKEFVWQFSVAAQIVEEGDKQSDTPKPPTTP